MYVNERVLDSVWIFFKVLTLRFFSDRQTELMCTGTVEELTFFSSIFQTICQILTVLLLKYVTDIKQIWYDDGKIEYDIEKLTILY